LKLSKKKKLTLNVVDPSLKGLNLYFARDIRILETSNNTESVVSLDSFVSLGCSDSEVNIEQEVINSTTYYSIPSFK
jgi:hypothetical protein